jgi:hypothetical protein
VTVAVVKHGRGGYARGCRCDTCRAANTTAPREWRRANHVNSHRWPPDPVRIVLGPLTSNPHLPPERAACANIGRVDYTTRDGQRGRVAAVDAWFPEGVHRQEIAAAAKAICYGCPIQAECLAAARARREEHGIWGGANFGDEARDRRRIRRQRRTEAAA